MLDAGCGPGHYTQAFSEKGFNAYGLDLSERMIEDARQEYPACTFEIGDLCSLGYPDGFFSVVFCMAAFQHVEKEGGLALRALRGFRRVLCDGGVLMLDVQLGRERGYEPDGRYTEAYATSEEAKSLVRDAGFESLDWEEKTLPPGQNTFARQLPLPFVQIYARKKPG